MTGAMFYSQLHALAQAPYAALSAQRLLALWPVTDPEAMAELELTAEFLRTLDVDVVIDLPPTLEECHPGQLRTLAAWANRMAQVLDLRSGILGIEHGHLLLNKDDRTNSTSAADQLRSLALESLSLAMKAGARA